MSISKAALKIQRDKEVAALMYNSKEQRVLEKSLQTIKQEQTYALKLLELDHRIIKVRYKKLKENVSKIKSHLPADDINSFRDLDLQGKLGASYRGGVNIGSAIKIAAAARRLNLGAGFRRRGTTSALPVIAVEEENRGIGGLKSKSVVSINEPPVVQRLKRSNSITGAFIDAPGPTDLLGGAPRPASAIVASTNTHTGLTRPQISNGLSSETFTNGDTAANNLTSNVSQVQNGIPPQSFNSAAEVYTGRHNANTSLKSPRLALSTNGKDNLGVPALGGAEEEEGDDDFIHRPLLSVRSSSSMPGSRSPFSSHSPSAARDVKARMASAPARQRRRLSHISTDSIDSNLGENCHEERRQELLEEEGVRSATLNERTKVFLKDVDDYLERNPPLQFSHIAFENGVPEPPRRDSLIDPTATAQRGEGSRRFQQRSKAGAGPELDATPTFFPEADYKERLMGLWKDMNKCRYLRVADDKIDLSGVNTLVKDHMQMFETLKNAERPPLQKAWES